MSVQDASDPVLLHDAPRPHWNDDIPGIWIGPVRLAKVGSYIGKYVKAKPGVYRLIALADPDSKTPAVLDRICGRDQTGTLYIGCAERTVRFRLQQLARSSREYRRAGREHNAPRHIRRNKLLLNKFPRSKLAVAWCYEKHYRIAEGNLLATYIESFGEAPPLNGHPDVTWFDLGKIDAYLAAGPK